MFRPRKPFVRDFQNCVRIHSRGYLPHWEAADGIYFITFRLADSLPREVVESLKRQREEIEQKRRRDRGRLSLIDRQEISRLYSLRVDHYLDAGSGECELRDPRAARIVVDALRFFDETRYQLKSFCVMPNHVHVIMRPTGDWLLKRILFSWKSYTSHEINKVLGRKGQLWQEEYYDHLIRDEQELLELTDYVANTPVKAGLVDWPWVGLEGDDR